MCLILFVFQACRFLQHMAMVFEPSGLGAFWQE
jgi:hypothetical protein